MNCNKNGRNDGQSRVPSHPFFFLFIKMDEQHIIHLLKKINDVLLAVINYIRFIHLKWSKKQASLFGFKKFILNKFYPKIFKKTPTNPNRSISNLETIFN